MCGAIRYECSGPIESVALCHCESCRRVSGAHIVAWLTVRADGLKFTQGSPREFASSAPVLRTFCAQCGTPLTYRHRDSPASIDVTVATLDDPNSVAPEYHVWMEDAVRWERGCDALPRYQTSRAADASVKPTR
jgi:hypothetical protein